MPRHSEAADFHQSLEDAAARELVGPYGAIIREQELNANLCQGQARSMCKFNKLQMTN
jgi:hypothetical protein